MTANTGRTSEIYLQIWIDNSGGTLTNLSSYLKSAGEYGLKGTEADVTGVADAIKNVIQGRPDAPLTFTWQIDTILIAHMVAIWAQRNTPLSLDIRQGIRQSPAAGEPVFGITSTATSGYVLKSFTMNATEVKTEFSVFGPTAPDFGTSVHS